MDLDLKPQVAGGEGLLVAHYGAQRFTADWNNPAHRVRRLLAVAIAAITSGAYLVAAIYFLGDMSAHFDPVVTLAFLHGDSFPRTRRIMPFSMS